MIDVSYRSALAICDHCGRRELHPDHASARAWMASHEAHAHPESSYAREALRLATLRSQMVADRTK